MRMPKDPRDNDKNKSYLEMQYDRKREFDDLLSSMRFSKFLDKGNYKFHKSLRKNVIDMIAIHHTIELQSEFESLIRKLTIKNDIEPLEVFMKPIYKPKKSDEMLLRGLHKLDMDRLNLLSDFFEIHVDESTDRFNVYKETLVNREKYAEKLHRVFEMHYCKLKKFNFIPSEVVKYGTYLCVVQKVNRDQITIFNPLNDKTFVVSSVNLNQRNPERLIVKKLLSKRVLMKKLNIFKLCGMK
jgi:hypothetical protein